MRFLVLGSTGMTGHVISMYLKEKGYEVHGFARRQLQFVDTILGDALDSVMLKKTIINGCYDFVINAIGVLNQLADIDKAKAVYLNGYLPHFLAEITKDTNTKIIHISTDCVYSGINGNYKEDAIPDGISFYDRTKAIGELIDKKNITFRMSLVGPDMNIEGLGLLNWFMKQNEPVIGYKMVNWTGITTLQIAKAVEAAAKQNVYGLYNLVYDKSISKYDLLRLFNKHIRANTIIINQDNEKVINKTLIRTNYMFDFEIPSYEIMISQLKVWMRDHDYLYPHYKIALNDYS